MYSEKQLKECWNAAKEGVLTYDEFNTSLSKVDDEDVNWVLDEWKSHRELILSKPTIEIKKAIRKTIASYSLDDCLIAIKNYVEILSSNFYYQHKWSILKFFKQKNGIIEFMYSDNYKGDVYINFLDWKKNRKKQPYSSLSASEKESVNKTYESLKDSYRKNKYPHFHHNSMSETPEADKKMAFDGVINKISPIFFCVACEISNTFLDEPFLMGRYNFSTKFDKIVYSNGVELNYMEEYNKIIGVK